MRTWKYEANLIRIVDGDTIVCDIDQGMNHWSRHQYIRFAGINAPELNTNEGQAAKVFLETLIIPDMELWLITVEYHEFEKYGRVLAYIYTTDQDVWDSTNLLAWSINQSMLDSGHAVVYP